MDIDTTQGARLAYKVFFPGSRVDDGAPQGTSTVHGNGISGRKHEVRAMHPSQSAKGGATTSALLSLASAGRRRLSSSMPSPFDSWTGRLSPHRCPIPRQGPGTCPSRSRTVPPPGVPLCSQIQCTWMGHASVLVRMDGMRVLTDPVFSDRCSALQWMGPKRVVPAPVSLGRGIREQIGDLDLVIVSHSHYDHLDQNTVKVSGCPRGGAILPHPDGAPPLDLHLFVPQQPFFRAYPYRHWTRHTAPHYTGSYPWD